MCWGWRSIRRRSDGRASDVWAEIWDVCGPQTNKVFRDGEASFMEDVRLFMHRGDFLEETYYSFSYSPIRDESGGVGGLFCPSTDTTPKILGARRLKTLSDLAGGAYAGQMTDSACAMVARELAKNPDDVPFALLSSDSGSNRGAVACGVRGPKIATSVVPTRALLARTARVASES